MALIIIYLFRLMDESAPEPYGDRYSPSAAVQKKAFLSTQSS